MDRFIPACAGNACAARMTESCSPVHPRVCGKREDRGETTRHSRGSSPRVRGTQADNALRLRCGRFIPACAGKRQRPVGRQLDGGGSSPRVRGTPRCLPTPKNNGRFIPACAGNAASRSISTALNPVHPRVCGERFILQIARSGTSVHPRVCGERGRHPARWRQILGSSPRVRGTPRRRARQRPTSRFIPACAGNACSLRSFVSSIPVHPRVCGERSCQ